GYKTLYGIGYAEVTTKGEGFEVVEDEDEQGLPVVENIDAEITIVSGEKGRGSAFDVGVAVEINDNLYVDVAIINIGQLKWDDAQQRIYEAYIDHQADESEPQLKETGPAKDLANYAIDAPQTLRAGI